jgi:hypothetical protein
MTNQARRTTDEKASNEKASNEKAGNEKAGNDSSKDRVKKVKPEETSSNALFQVTQRSQELQDVLLAIPSGLDADHWDELKSELRRYLDIKDKELSLSALCGLVQSAAEEAATKEEGAMVHLLLGRYDNSNHWLDFFNCGIHSLILYHHQFSEMSSIGSNGLPVGPELRYLHQQHRLPMHAHDTLYALWRDHCYSLEINDSGLLHGSSSETARIPKQFRERFSLYAGEQYGVSR